MSPTTGSGAVIAAGMTLFRRTSNGPEWLLLRNSRRQEWGLPKGHMDAGESIEQTARRECAEECGIALLRFLGPQSTLSYQLPNQRLKQVTYFLAVTKQTYIRLSPEHDAYQWSTTETAINSMPFDMLRQLLHDAAEAIIATDTN